MLVLGTDWATLSSLATAAGTLVLAIATFAAVRSSNQSARVAEMALQEQRRPMLAPSRFSDPAQKLMFGDGHWVTTEGGQAAAQQVDDVIYLAISLRNVGNGIGVCQAWAVTPRLERASRVDHMPEGDFRLQTRDLYIPPGDIGMWQGALRDPEDPLFEAVARALESEQAITIELLYSDQMGAQRTITRFSLIAKEGARYTSMTRHWFLEWEGPRSGPELEEAIRLAGERVEARRSSVQS
ncbi:MAG TPA: hypothetical protein VME01_05910 [Solirubrobacteraceae bacterium]|nr:hypothetical protein [Solirubrobacteraceae bacterium]